MAPLFARVATTLTLASLVLTATPAAAMGLHLGVNATDDESVRVLHQQASAHVEEHENNSVQVHDTDDVAGKMKGHAAANLEKMRDHRRSVVERIINMFARVSQRICERDDDATHPVADCLAVAKSSFQASVTAMINAAFVIK